jgi:LPXTG-motif cell wall-anchored protein
LVNWKTTPTIDGYTPTIASVATKPVTYGTDSVTVDITYTPNAQTTNIVYKDKDGQTIKTDKVDGKTNETVKVDSTIPVGWKLLDGHKPAPKTVKFGPEGHPDIVIEIEHNITKVPHDNPVPENGKTPTDKPIDGAHEDDLNQTITRTINVKNPDGTTDTTTQTAKIYRDASYDDVTGEVTYGDWSTATWDAFNTPTIKDYTPSQAEVPAVIVQDGQKDEVVNITYVPVPKPEQGEQVIHYVDGDDGDKVISTQVVKGKDGEDVSFTPNIPNNFVPATDIPLTVKISGSTTTITLKHKTTDASQTKIITRTITENFPSGATKTETQSATLTETGTKDLVTGEIKWHNDWTTGEWQKFTPATVPGYTPSEAEVPAVEVKDGQKDVTITINYSPTEQTGKISYQDKDGNEIGTTPLTGKTDETIPVDPNKDVPAGWKIIPDQKIPETVKVTPDGVPTVVVKIEHKTITVTPETPEEEIPMGKVPGDPSKTYPVMESITKTPTRKITVIKPDGSKLVIEQIVEFTRTATFDEVTGEVIYTDWKLAKSNAQGGKAQWDAYIPQAISGYTMHIEQKVGDKTTAINSIDAAEVTEATGDVTITVTYVAINPGGNGGNSDDTDHTIPEEPIKPDDHKPEVPVKTPNETSDDTEIDTTPKDQDLESGPAVIKGYEENNAPLYEDMNNSAPARNNNSISPKGADTYASTNAPAKAASAKTEENSGKHELPQTGEKQNEAGIFGILAMVLGLFGLANRKKKKDE